MEISGFNGYFPDFFEIKDFLGEELYGLRDVQAAFLEVTDFKGENFWIFLDLDFKEFFLDGEDFLLIIFSFWYLFLLTAGWGSIAFLAAILEAALDFWYFSRYDMA